MTRGPDKQFSPDEALETAMNLFWENGYAATGMADLQKQMGIGRKSLYDTFGCKRDLYIKSLRHYAQSHTAKHLAILKAEGSPLDNIKKLVQDSIEMQTAPDAKGCMLAVGMAESCDEQAESSAFLCQMFHEMQSAIHETIDAAKAAGEISEDIDSTEQAALFVATLQGMSLMARVGMKEETIKGTGRALLDKLS